MKKIYTLICLIFLASCSGYLEESPDSTHDVSIDNPEKIAELLTAAYPRVSYFPFLELRSDNVGDRLTGDLTQLSEAMYLWQDYDQDDIDTPLAYWNACYAGIAQANKALELLASYPKTERIKALYGEAFLLRAYLHFMLVSLWSEPYRGDESTSLGIPYIEKPEKHALVDYDRGTVAEVYRLIEADLKRGVTLVNDRYYEHPKYHFNKRAAYAFATRFYLHKGDWQSVVAYSDYVLGVDVASALRPWFVLSASLSGRQTIGLPSRYRSRGESSNLLLATVESRWARELPTLRYGTTLDICSKVFDKAGLNTPGSEKNLNLGSLYLFASSPTSLEEGVYIPKFEERTVGEVMGTRPRDIWTENVLFSADEVLLNRMEAYTMLREYDKAIDDMLVYMKGKFNIDPSVPRKLYTSGNSNDYKIYSPYYGLTMRQLALIKTIVEFRHKEFMHEGLRWFDLRRFYMPVERRGAPSGYRPLEKNDPRKTLQIPNEAIGRGLKPNHRDFIEQKHPF